MCFECDSLTRSEEEKKVNRENLEVEFYGGRVTSGKPEDANHDAV